MALAHLEQEPIASVDDTGANGSIMRVYYDTALQTSLMSHDWDFATTFQSLALISSADNLSPYQYLYAEPTNFLKFQRMYDDDGNDVPYIKTNDGIYADANPCYVQFTKFVDDYSKFNAHFVELLSFRLAELSAERILGSTSARDFLGQEHNKKQAVAASNSIGRSNSKAKMQSDWVQARYT